MNTYVINRTGLPIQLKLDDGEHVTITPSPSRQLITGLILGDKQVDVELEGAGYADSHAPCWIVEIVSKEDAEARKNDKVFTIVEILPSYLNDALYKLKAMSVTPQKEIHPEKLTLAATTTSQPYALND